MIFCILFLGGGFIYNQLNYDSKSVDSLTYELEPVKLNTIWSNSKIGEVARYKINENNLLIVSENSLIYNVNLLNGDTTLLFDNPTNITYSPERFICTDKYIVIKYEISVLVLDINTYEIIKEITKRDLGDGNIGDVGIKENVIFYWSYPRESIIARDIFSLKELWTYGGNRKEHGVISIDKIEDEYYFVHYADHEYAFKRFNNNSGVVYTEASLYTNNGTKLEVNYLNNSPKDVILEEYAKKIYMNNMKKISYNKFYKIYSGELTIYDDVGNYIYIKDLVEEVKGYGLLGDNLFVSLGNDEMVIIDTNKGVIIDKFPFKAAGRSPIIEYEDSLILCSEDGSGYIYERIKIE